LSALLLAMGIFTHINAASHELANRICRVVVIDAWIPANIVKHLESHYRHVPEIPSLMPWSAFLQAAAMACPVSNAAPCLCRDSAATAGKVADRLRNQIRSLRNFLPFAAH